MSTQIYLRVPVKDFKVYCVVFFKNSSISILETISSLEIAKDGSELCKRIRNLNSFGLSLKRKLLSKSVPSDGPFTNSYIHSHIHPLSDLRLP